MKNVRLFLFLGAAFLISTLYFCKSTNQPSESLVYPDKVLQLDAQKAAELSEQIKKEVSIKVAEGLELDLWASDSLVTDPIAISMDDQGGIYYTNAVRLGNSEFDIRGHRDWMTESISWQHVEDRRAFLRKELAPENSEKNKSVIEDLNEDGSHDWRDLLVEKETVWRVEDADGDGLADKAKLYIEDFHEEISDLANGVEVHNGDVFIAVGPDLWRTTDTDGDGIADQKESISHGWAVHIGFGAHGMSGVKVGPQGRIWWGIGDIGMNVIDKDGKNWKYPNQGVIVRCDPDGSNFEVFARGLRNTHEFVFDQYGNLISEDNDGDHRGERERLVYITNGSDGGWRTNWQFGKYTDPDNNGYKVWMDEKLNIPRWEGQAAHITPPIINYVNGPTGMVYNPGTALGEQWQNHFFIAEFRGNPANSPLHAFTLKPNGASFELDKTQEVVNGVLPTGLDWGPDGALYFADWIDGWGVKNEGRIWKLDVPNVLKHPLRAQTKQLIQSDFSTKDIQELSELLAYADMRIRKKAQFELAKKGQAGYDALLSVANTSDNQLARIHALWGISQLARQDAQYGATFVPFLDDSDPEIQAQAAKMIGDIRYKGAGDKLVRLLKNPSLRIQFFAAEALGRTEDKQGIQPIIDMLEANNDDDAWLRHAGVLALARIGEADPIIALKDNPSRALRIAAVVALRRMENPAVTQFLEDEDEFIVTEAARAINDDWSIEAALPALAMVLKNEKFTSEPLIRRAINANLRVGKAENITILTDYINRIDVPEAMRAEALATLSGWAKPSVLDRVDGRYRGVVERDATPAIAAIQPHLNTLLNENQAVVQIAATKVASKLKIADASTTLFALVQNSPTDKVREAALTALAQLDFEQMPEALEIALADKSKHVRSSALSLLATTDLPEAKAVNLFTNILENGTVAEKQATMEALGKMQSVGAVKVILEQVQKLTKGTAQPEIQLDILEAAENNGAAVLTNQASVYQRAKVKDDPLAEYAETLAGGNARKGQNIFYRNEAAQCVRCHAIWEWGGDAGPVLAGIGSKRTAKELLESIIEPSAQYAPGYGIAILTLKDETTKAGIVEEETDEWIKLRIGKDEPETIAKAQIAERDNVPSSMPGVKDKLDKKQIRDLVAFLVSLKEEES
ncbi:MAG: HEAT repeat domain-containing protein [Bacteroidota bacterium]